LCVYKKKKKSRNSFRNSRVLWCISIIPALRRLRKEDHESKASVGHISRPCLKKTKTNERQKRKK
jgi:mannose/fructose/N-acetylgalactosamine-specific phosphotransferase system component IID